MNKLYCNIDTNCFFHTPLDGREGNTGEAVDKYVDRLAEAGVKHLLVNTNARRTNYRSQAWDAWWDGYDPDGPDIQPFFAALPGAEIGAYRRALDNMLALHNAGVDYPGRMRAGARRHGMVAWISLRMNDVHSGKIRNHPFHGRFWREHPDFARQNCGGTHAATALDYARPEVREFFGKLIRESLERYDLDGLELDFMRGPWLFSKDAEAEGGRLLTAWLGEIRGWTDAAAKRLGYLAHPRTRFVLFHAGYPWTHEVGGLAHNHGNVLPSLTWTATISTSAASRRRTPSTWRAGSCSRTDGTCIGAGGRTHDETIVPEAQAPGVGFELTGSSGVKRRRRRTWRERARV